MQYLLPCVVLFFISCEGTLEVPDALRNGVKGNPGMQTCVRRRFLQSLSELFGILIDNEIPKIHPPDTTVPLGPQMTLKMEKLVFDSFDPSSHQHSVSFRPPNETVWTSRGLNFNMSGQFHSTIQQIISSSETSGSISLSATNAGLVIRIRIRRLPSGNQQFSMVNCVANFSHTSVRTQSSGFFGALSAFFQKILSQSSTRLLERITCNTARYYIETVLNEMYEKGIPSNLSMSDPFPSQLIFNYALQRDARVYKNCLGMQTVGEVSWENRGGTPFSPARLNYTTKSIDDHMLDVWISDYSFNSLLYHANEHGLLEFTLNEGEWHPHLQTQCSNSGLGSIRDCIGIAIPELSNLTRFPSQVVEMRMKSSPSLSPYVIFQSGNHVTLFTELVIELYANDTKGARKNILIAEAHVESNIRGVKLGNIDGAVKMTAEAADTNATLKITKDQLSLDAASAKARRTTLGDFAASVFQRFLNRKLTIGFVVPKYEGMKMVRPDTAFFNHTMNIATDIELDGKYWLNEASKARVRVQKKNA